LNKEGSKIYISETFNLNKISSTAIKEAVIEKQLICLPLYENSTVKFMLNQKQKDKIDQMFENGGLESFWKSLRLSVVKADNESKRTLLKDLLDYAIDKNAELNESPLSKSITTQKTTNQTNKRLETQENEDEEPMRLFTFMNSHKSGSNS
jgi:hypothetical protein